MYKTLENEILAWREMNGFSSEIVSPYFKVIARREDDDDEDEGVQGDGTEEMDSAGDRS